ncbi:CBS domain-containing protein [Pullulanibacillus pueri]|uniref:CBS domain-containing protein n=1 Tax=Pullulanibacillus pueri TaxID=1437324 RepID=A0A8J2ZZ44_9BACL|nr:CBS domain-containing protein [Pullulanibacillus pueri]MBM7683908.1 CBS domain-containing protein [Pullulanibacillus pueri]GGH87809.1 CBS domain-containing protein [Pullulanibacillus pueri]
MKVADFMIHDVITVHSETPIKELLKLLIEHNIGGVPVVDKENKLIGMVSDGDIIRYLSPREEAVHDLFFTVYVEKGETAQEVLDRKMDEPVTEMMKKKHLYTVNKDDDFEVALRLLSQHHFKKLPVVDADEKVIGVVSRGDIVHNLSKMIISRQKD